MKSKIKSVLVVLVAMIGGALVSCLIFGGGPSSAKVAKVRDVKVTKTAVRGNVKKVTEISLVNNNGKKAVRIVESQQVRPGSPATETVAVSDDIDEENLTDKQKEVLKELQDALDAEDIRRVRKALSRFLAKVSEGGLDGQVPICMREKAVEALGWFGKEAAIDLIPFAADANDDVASAAFEQFESALSDCDMSDRMRAELVSAYLRASSDAEQIDSLLNQLNDMRNSVKVATAQEILTSGTDRAKAMMSEQLESYFEDSVKSANDLNRWQAENPDDDGDVEFYGK